MAVSTILNLFTAPLEFIYWLKWAASYIAIRAYNAFKCKRFALYDLDALGDPVKLGFLVPNIEKELESPFPESHLQEAADEVAFYGVNSQSECLLVRIARGCNQQADAWIYLKLANGKTYYLMETKGFQQSFEGNSQSFSCGKLQMHYLCPMRKWRIFYCGMLKEISDNNKKVEEVVFAKFVFLWKAASDVYDCTLDTNIHGFASAMARSDWRVPLVPPIKNLVDALNIYGQSGVISGTISINDGSDYEMYLFGAKIRSLGKSASIAGCKFTSILGSTPSNGLNFHLSNVSLPYAFKNLPFGFVVDPDGLLEPLKDLDIAIKPIAAKEQQSSFKASFTAGEQYELSGSIAEPIVFYSGQGWSGFLELSFIEFNVGDRKGYGLIMSGEVYNIPKRTGKSLSIRAYPEPIPLTVQFTDEACQFGEVSGGKGSSLGKLTELSQEDKTFIVPKGIVVTTTAYKQFLTSEILEASKYLENVVYGNDSGDIKNACQKISSVIEETSLPNNICHSIVEDLKDLFGDEVNQRKFAVRSSATGEDTATMSAAGQMDTFLGVQGLNEIFSAVKKCWASQFGHIAVEYKRRNGQILNSPMAVVIQDMVACEVSGVLFTCDPVTNNPSIITITANYGLGETVVSGSVEPDTILLRRMDDGKLKVEDIVIGTKHQKIIMKDSGGTVTEDIDDQSKLESCVSKKDAERLGKLSLKIEDYYKSSRDIEWGMLNGKIYILQSRPVTNAASETDNEIKHEFDAPLRCEKEYFTVANVGEVMPGASSPLGVDLLSKCFSNVLKREARRKGGTDNLLSSRYYPNGLLTFYNHMMMTAVEMLIRYGYDTPKSKGLMVSIFGRVLDDPDLMSYAKERAKEGEEPSIIAKIPQQLKDYWYLFTFDFGLEKVKEKTFNYKLDFLKKETAKETFAAMLSACSDFDDALEKHIDASTSSSDWNMIMFNILCEAKGSFDIDVYSDFARLLATSSDVESANVPQAMQEVATQIVKDIGKEKFSSMSVKEATEWLQTTSASSGYMFRQFLNRHGHRCLKEFDVRSITWEMDPKLLVQLLQSMTGMTKEDSNNKEESIDNIFSQLNVPLNFMSRWMLKFVVPNCRRGVRARETTKSLSVKSFDHWRKGVRRLGKQMVSEGRLPEEELIFFMTLDEINDLLNTRSPIIISRASHRRKIFPTLENYKFPEIMKGIPKPINDEEESADTYEFIADLTMKGTPVSVGVTKGYARVAISLEEASHLQSGEILITYSTDIGWSPYFPIVSGVVTELGGLISHGAVVSREYGLPCVVGLQGATKKFHTGDYVLLDGKKGILQRLPKPE
ncbi:prodigiosin synthesizing transferase PigC-like [Argiope bruennichi]|uniref:prodigiosin synthesizing transferase PigC-like n=1 Tax=Argiope bruennichi TaxID=94029 RepID=UPI00249504BD|nr:prodigiosin synthesizing transferase PigC-like [Argiope bruennichi]